MPLIGDIHYEEAGSGPPLLLVSGLSGVAGSWAAQVERLAPHRRVVTHDHRGTGRSAASRIDYSVAQMADDVLALMDGLGLERADMVGHSTGGAIVQWIALEHPRRLGRAVLSATWSRPDPYFVRSFALRKELLRTLGPAAYARLSSLTMYPPDWLSANAEAADRMERDGVDTFPPLEIVESRIDAICRFDVHDRLGAVTAPTLVLCAVDDRITPVHLSRAIEDAVPGASGHYLDWGGHAAPRLAADRFAAAVIRFLGDG